jgi:cytidine deaminase
MPDSSKTEGSSMTEDTIAELIREARTGRERALAPFSGFKVGAALRTKAGRIIRGCNIENSSFGLTVCAERVALLAALADGEREFEAVAVVTQSEKPSPPCGPCRQLMWEYCGDIDVILSNLDGTAETLKLSDLFPRPFEFKVEK